ncbi:uncharacterized protein EV420DRAFT_1480098 [Desarmillaria tabescens]|uniref:Uncharacterized protein n=1 Tax=Armillaria tabescens TaxID=1929756 RepID=A0AA39KB98_ARMTA|nr:uncharacterized protein EV420DRAFT_1480098 [Desarmillaria tabescens]KAK0457915.1 hypothetical protein EV420DRAFT_1480098 [Desarmillaria tabescens]
MDLPKSRDVSTRRGVMIEAREYNGFRLGFMRRPEWSGLRNKGNHINTKNRESNRKYERVSFKTEKAEYRHVLTHAPNQRIPNIQNSRQAGEKELNTRISYWVDQDSGTIETIEKLLHRDAGLEVSRDNQIY